MTKPSHHQRAENQQRFRQASSQMEAAYEWCAEMLVILTIKNDGQHWLFTRGENLVEWWPSTSKCVVNKRWKSARQVNSWNKLVPVLLKELVGKRREEPVAAIREDAALDDSDETLDEWSEHAFDWDAEACPFEVEAR